jgi:folate-binding protein YgfZ
MIYDTPLRSRHEAYARELARREPAPAARPGAATGVRTTAGVDYIPYRTAAGSDLPAAPPLCELVGGFGEVEAEYAAIRKAAGLFDAPHRGTLHVTGIDRRDFLNRMVTQELRDLVPGVARPAFWLNRRGRVEADLLLIETGDHIVIDLDIIDAAKTAGSLTEFIFSEDVDIRDVSAMHHHLAVHGRAAVSLVAGASGDTAFRLDDGCASKAILGGTEVVVARRDIAGEPGFEVIAPREHAAAVWDGLVQSAGADGRSRARPIGWYALNIARIEAGSPVFHIDFDTSSLPHETGVLRDRVSFTKGCYIGQEIVARMENLGKPRQMLVGLRVNADLLPVAGAQVFARSEGGGLGDQIGVVTSSTLSPMLGAVPVAFALLRTAAAERGGSVLVNAEGDQAEAEIQPLRFWSRETAAL